MKKLIVLASLGLMLFSHATFAGTQQERMKACNKEAKEKSLKGDERKAFMKTCLSGKETAAADKTAAKSKK
ncbi:MAG: PsiF family protein [Gallionellaceae bacterium]|nr:PsiF family protein [Gallionellaceae bacterium]